FFKALLSIVGSEVCQAVKDLFSNGKLLKEVNATIMALVPKCQSPFKVSDYRPIACCNVLYKCISKVIANRLKGVLNSLVNDCQSAFIPTRQISDNILLTQELLRNYHRNIGRSKKMRISNSMEMCKLCFLHLCFADDLMIFSHGDKLYVSVLKSALEEFSGVSGLMPTGSLPIRYLGVPLISTRLYKRHCNDLMDKVKKRLQDWKNKSLSFSGRLQLINSVVDSLQVFWSSVFILPEYVALDIEKLMRGLIDRRSVERNFWDVPTLNDVCWGWNKILQCRSLLRDHFVYIIGDDKMKLEFAPNDLYQQERNLRLFQDKFSSVDVVCGIVREHVRLRLLSSKIRRSKQSPEATNIWKFHVMDRDVECAHVNVL
ncbi:putative RNA-directed DNA polymerase, eukaryota, reverse transcriptase zinc-binding domain protein, partial [Tanacetum coccineum]